MLVAVDTNVLGYAEGLDDPMRQSQANEVVDHLGRDRLVMPVQVAAELQHLIARRRRVAPAVAAEAVSRWMAFIPHHPPTLATTLQSALDLAGDHRLQMFDAIILAACAEAECGMLLSEDMHDGFVWRGVTVVNPFAPTPHPLLADLLRG